MRPTIREEGGRVGRFLIVGSLSVVTYYALLWGLTEFAGVWYIASAIVAFVGYYFVNFLSQKYWAFKNKDRDALNRQLAQYTLMAVANWVINTVLLYVLVEYLHLHYMVAQAILTVLVSIIAYFGFKYIFRLKPSPSA
ncbi:MAG: GtrA family protein [bacterium]|nr:GtrA family protein [bacterium]